MEAYLFQPVDELEALADDYIRYDSSIKMQVRNGMTRDMLINYAIVKYFMNDNDIKVEEDELCQITDESLMRVVNLCSQHYNKTKEELKEAYKRCTSLEFYDPERRAELE